MSFARKVVIAVNLNSNPKANYKTVKELEFLKDAEIHFVHVFPTIAYSMVYSDFPLLYPVEADRKSIEQSVVATLDHMKNEWLPRSIEAKTISKCLFSEDPKKKFCDYVKEVNADLVVVFTREKHGFFDSSFAQYAAKHTDSNIIIIKNKTPKA